MYVLSGIFLVLCIVFLLLGLRRRKKIIRRICCMDSCEKQTFLNELIAPFGFLYDGCEDIFFSATDAWQREFGYRALFDRAAPRFHMIFDCEPVYFEYNGKTWLIEFWKGQYGINTGAEIGVYCADEILSPDQYSHAQFHSVPEDQMLPMAMTLESHGKTLLCVKNVHWWLTGFRMGMFRCPKDLRMRISITFPDGRMKQSFVTGLKNLGYDAELCLCGHTVSLLFSTPHTKEKGIFHRLRKRLVQRMNRLFVRIFLLVTRPFSCTADRLLYLYEFLPFAFRHIIEIRCFSRKKGRSLKKKFYTCRKHHRLCARNGGHGL